MLRTSRGVLVLSILTLLLIPPSGPGGQGARVSPPPPSGDWTVSDATSIADTTIQLGGNLTILPGGILTLTNVVLVIKCSYPGQYRVDLRAGGELHLRSSNLTSGNDTLHYDFLAARGSVLDISGSEVHSAGSNWTADGSTNGLLVRTGNAVIQNSLFSGNLEALHVRDCSPSVINCTFRDNEAACVATNSSLVFRDCIVAGSITSGVMLLDRTNVSITGCNFTENFRWAILVNRSSVTVARNSFFRNYISIQAERSQNMLLENNSFIDDKYTALRFLYSNASLQNDTIVGAFRIAIFEQGSKVLAVNTTLASHSYDVHLEEGSTAELVNCTYQRYNIELVDPDSRFNVSWFLGANVRWWSDESPVPGAVIECRDAGGNLTSSGITDADGRFGWGLTREYTQGSRMREEPGPYTVTASKGGRATSAVVAANRSQVVEILLDDIGPAIRVDFPANGSWLNLTRLTLKGIAWDNETQVAKMECRVDNGTYLSASGTSYWEFTTGVLINGPHTVYVRGRDTANNTNIVAVSFTLDTLSPALTVVSPRDGCFTRDSNVTVNGTTEQNATVTINGLAVPLGNATGAFSLVVDLVEGDNYITVVARDRAGNAAQKVVRTRLDTMVAPFELNPANGSWTNQSRIDIWGRVEENSSLLIRSVDPYTNFTINETRQNVTTGNFTLSVPLVNGTNLFRVEVADRYGNTAQADLYIIQDRVPPWLNVTSPPVLEYYTRDRRLVLSGHLEKGADLYLNGRLMLVEDGNISKPLTLDLGENLINLTAVDAAGNSVSVLYKVYLDRTPPTLEITSPKRTASGKPQNTDRSGLAVKGTTEPGALVYITLNGKALGSGKPIIADSFGGFRKDVTLNRGVNTFEITAVDLAGNPRSEVRSVRYSMPPPILSNEQLAAMIVAAGLAVAFVVIVARDTKKTTGRWGLKRPVWLRVPETVKERARAIRAFIPKPTFGREEGEAGAGAVLAEPGKEGKEPEKNGAAHPPPPPAAVPAVPGAPPVGQEFAVSEKPAAAQPTAIPGATELPVAEPAPGQPAAAPGARPPVPAAPGAPPAPAQPPVPQPPPPEPEKPKELDPLAEILGAPTRKV